MMKTLEGAATVPLIVKSNGVSSESVLTNDSCPLKEPFVVASSFTTNVVWAPGVRIVFAGIFVTTLKPAGTLTGCRVRSAPPSFFTVNVRCSGEPAAVVPKLMLPLPSAMLLLPSSTVTSGVGFPTRSIRIPSAITYSLALLVSLTTRVDPVIVNEEPRSCQFAPASVRLLVSCS